MLLKQDKQKPGSSRSLGVAFLFFQMVVNLTTMKQGQLRGQSKAEYSKIAK